MVLKNKVLLKNIAFSGSQVPLGNPCQPSSAWRIYRKQSFPCRRYQVELGNEQIYDGGVAGLKLLALMEGRRRVVLVDSLEAEEFGAKIHVLDREQLAARAGNYGHGAGLPYLAAIAPHTLHPLPDILLVGSGGIHAAETVARTCLEVALYGRS
jgi:Ni,Fe-hydrogenase maturation factor